MAAETENAQNGPQDGLHGPEAETDTSTPVEPETDDIAAVDAALLDLWRNPTRAPGQSVFEQWLDDAIREVSKR